MNAASQLDNVLNLFDYNDDLHGLNGLDIRNNLNKQGIVFEINLQNEILLHLVKEGKLRIIEKEYSEYGKTQLVPYYLLTFEGGIIQDSGGYSGIKRRETTLEVLQSSQTWVIAVGTFLAGVYSIFQLFDYYENHYLDVQFAVYFLGGFVIALILSAILWQLSKISRKTKKLKT